VRKWPNGSSSDDGFVVGSTSAVARRLFSLLFCRGCVCAFCGKRPVQGVSGGLLRSAEVLVLLRSLLNFQLRELIRDGITRKLLKYHLDISRPACSM